MWEIESAKSSFLTCFVCFVHETCLLRISAKYRYSYINILWSLNQTHFQSFYFFLYLYIFSTGTSYFQKYWFEPPAIWLCNIQCNYCVFTLNKNSTIWLQSKTTIIYLCYSSVKMSNNNIIIELNWTYVVWLHVFVVQNRHASIG